MDLISTGRGVHEAPRMGLANHLVPRARSSISGRPGIDGTAEDSGHCSSRTGRSRMFRSGLTSVIPAALLLGVCHAGQAQEATSGGAVTLFQNVRIFDGKSGSLSGPSHVLVRGN